MSLHRIESVDDSLSQKITRSLALLTAITDVAFPTRTKHVAVVCRRNCYYFNKIVQRLLLNSSNYSAHRKVILQTTHYIYFVKTVHFRTLSAFANSFELVLK